jgi:hypothetical protein
MKTFKIVFSKAHNRLFPIGSYLIRGYLRTEYSHVSYHFIDELTGQEMVYEAVGSGLRFISKERWLQHAEITCSFELLVSLDTYLKIRNTCIRFSGQDYGYLQNLGILIADMFSLDYNPFPENQNCSEILARILEEEGFKFAKNRNLLTPRDIEHALLLKINYLDFRK